MENFLQAGTFSVVRGAVKSAFFGALESGKNYRRGEITKEQYAESLASQTAKGGAKAGAKSAARTTLAVAYDAASGGIQIGGRVVASEASEAACCTSSHETARAASRITWLADSAAPSTAVETTGSLCGSAASALGLCSCCAATCRCLVFGAGVMAMLESVAATAGVLGAVSQAYRAALALDQLWASRTDDAPSSATQVTRYTGLLSLEVVTTSPHSTGTMVNRKILPVLALARSPEACLCCFGNEAAAE